MKSQLLLHRECESIRAQLVLQTSGDLCDLFMVITILFIKLKIAIY